MDKNWQSTGSLADTSLRMLEEELLYDITFLAGNSMLPVRAHKSMLASRSSVFYAMFCYGGPWWWTGQIVVPDIEAHTLKDLFKYMYSGISKVDNHTVFPLWYAAKRYDIVGMMQECGKYLKSVLTARNVCSVLEKAILYYDKNVIEDCYNVIVQNGEAVLETTGFLTLTPAGLQCILVCEKLNAKEENVYCSCIKWARERCKARGQKGNSKECREELGPLLYLIRFPCMSQEYFTTNVSTRSILSEEEKLDVFQQLCSSEAVGKFFNKTPRDTGGTTIVVERFSRVVNENWSILPAEDTRVSFRCSKNVYLTGYGLYRPRKPESVHSGKIMLYKDGTKHKLQTTNVKLSYKEKVLCENITLETPQYLTKDTVYTVALKSSTRMERYGKDGIQQFRDGVSGLEVSFLKSGHSSIKEGLLPRLMFDLR